MARKASRPLKEQLRPLLILDLDETLIHASSTLLRADFDFRVFHYYVYKRPGLDQFLRSCAGWFELAIWSSASDDYVAEIVQRIIPADIPLAFVWGRSRCTMLLAPQLDEYGYYNTDFPSHYDYAKKLRKVRAQGFDLQKVLIVDDTPHKVQNCYGNAIYPTPYLGDANDSELPVLLRYLETLSTVPNLRSVEKRQWRQRMAIAPE